MMPDIDGPTTYQILKQNGNTAHIPVLLLTAKVQGQDRRKLDELGAAAILSKPFDPLTLADQISDILGWEPPGGFDAYLAGTTPRSQLPRIRGTVTAFSGSPANFIVSVASSTSVAP